MEKVFVATVALLFALNVLLAGGIAGEAIGMAFGKTIIPAAIGYGLVLFARRRGKSTTGFAATGVVLVCLFAPSSVNASYRDMRRTVGATCESQMTAQSVPKPRAVAYCGCMTRNVAFSTFAEAAIDKLAGGTRARDGMQSVAGSCQAEALRIP